MKNLSKIFMLIAFISAGASMVINIINGTSWSWQVITMMWVFVAYMNEKVVDRYKNLIDKMSK